MRKKYSAQTIPVPNICTLAKLKNSFNFISTIFWYYLYSIHNVYNVTFLQSILLNYGLRLYIIDKIRKHSLKLKPLECCTRIYSRMQKCKPVLYSVEPRVSKIKPHDWSFVRWEIKELKLIYDALLYSLQYYY